MVRRMRPYRFVHLVCARVFKISVQHRIALVVEVFPVEPELNFIATTLEGFEELTGTAIILCREFLGFPSQQVINVPHSDVYTH